MICFWMKTQKGFCILMSKMSIKKRSILTAAAILALLSSGCRDKNTEMTKILQVGVVVYSQDDPFINAMADKLKENLKSMETEDIKIIVSVKSGSDDQQDQNETV